MRASNGSLQERDEPDSGADPEREASSMEGIFDVKKRGIPFAEGVEAQHDRKTIHEGTGVEANAAGGRKSSGDAREDI